MTLEGVDGEEEKEEASGEQELFITFDLMFQTTGWPSETD